MTKVEELLKELEEHDKSWEDFCEDPMTQYYGVAGDFRPSHEAKEREIICEIMRLAEPGSEAHEYACGRLEKWMP